jgi:hypothetical protein
VLERRGFLVTDPVNPYLEIEAGSSIEQIQAASIAYRIAIGPHTGRKALTLYSVAPQEEQPGTALLARLYGFSLHAGIVCEVHQRDKLVAPMNWAQRLKRVFVIDIEACPECWGTLRVIA